MKIKEQLNEIIPDCCNIGFASLANIDRFVESKFLNHYKDYGTIIAIAHHVTNPTEWIWYKFDPKEISTCDADIHLKQVCVKVLNILNNNNSNSSILPYPGRSGFLFKNLAAKTNLGEIGKSELFVHRNWGPWVHLRIILTSLIIKPDSKILFRICKDCNLCLKNCISRAIGVDKLNKEICEEYHSRIEKEKSIIKHYVFTCELCLRSCPKFEKPKQLTDNEISEFISNKYDKFGEL